MLGRPALRRRRLIDGIRRRVRTGAPWRDLPPEYGPWQTVYGLFRRCQRDGVWAAVPTRLQAQADAAGLITWDVNVDSRSAGPISTRRSGWRPAVSAPAGPDLTAASNICGLFPCCRSLRPGSVPVLLEVQHTGQRVQGPSDPLSPVSELDEISIGRLLRLH
ncbi:transposase [Streptomyces cyaneofuscatus]